MLPAWREISLAAYLLAGPESDHECRSARECREKVRQGMHVNLKTSSLSNHLPDALEGIRDHRWHDSVSCAQMMSTQG